MKKNTWNQSKHQMNVSKEVKNPTAYYGIWFESIQSEH